MSQELTELKYHSKEEFEEIEELDEDIDIPHREIWEEIEEKFYNDRKEAQKYKKSTDFSCVVSKNPTVQFLNEEIFPILLHTLEKTIFKAKEMECIKYQKSKFNGIDFIAEMLWNLNPRYPERKDNWTYVFDMDWVEFWLTEHPRPFFPLSWIWNRNYAALKIQSYMRGYWVRRREEVQEVRLFWKDLAKDKLEKQEGRIIDIQCGDCK